MQITTLEQLDQVRPNHTLFLINPFGNGNQANVQIEEFTVHAAWANRFTGRGELKKLSIDRASDKHFTDMLSGCKYVYTLESEAESKLKDIHKGLHNDEVKSHHDSCKEAFNHWSEQ